MRGITFLLYSVYRTQFSAGQQQQRQPEQHARTQPPLSANLDVAKPFLIIPQRLLYYTTTTATVWYTWSHTVEGDVDRSPHPPSLPPLRPRHNSTDNPVNPFFHLAYALLLLLLYMLRTPALCCVESGWQMNATTTAPPILPQCNVLRWKLPSSSSAFFRKMEKKGTNRFHPKNTRPNKHRMGFCSCRPLMM